MAKVKKFLYCRLKYLEQKSEKPWKFQPFSGLWLEQQPG